MSKEAKVKQILKDSFYENGSIAYVIGNDSKKDQRLDVLLDFSYKMGLQFGKIYLTEDEKACAIILYSDQLKTTLQTLFWEAKLLFRCIGFGNVINVLKREARLKQHHPKAAFIHLWYIGVASNHQGQGAGGELLQQILAEFTELPVYLEASSPLNFQFYEKHGFRQIALLDELGYELRVYRKG